MLSLPDLIRDKFFKVLIGEFSTSAFEQWLYTTDSLTQIFCQEDYLDLISLDFSKRDTKYRIDKILRRYIDLGEYETWKLKNLLLAFIHKDGNSLQMLSDFYDLYCNGYYFLDSLGLGYGLCSLESWSELSSKQLDSLLQGAMEEAQKVLTWLEANKIVITNIQDDLGHYLFIDTRTDEKKRPTWQKSKPWWNFWE